jgi:hypothetical protein
VYRILIGGLSVRARCAIFAYASVCLPQPLEIDVVGQRCERRVSADLTDSSGDASAQRKDWRMASSKDGSRRKVTLARPNGRAP